MSFKGYLKGCAPNDPPIILHDHTIRSRDRMLTGMERIYNLGREIGIYPGHTTFFLYELYTKRIVLTAYDLNV